MQIAVPIVDTRHAQDSPVDTIETRIAQERDQKDTGPQSTEPRESVAHPSRAKADHEIKRRSELQNQSPVKRIPAKRRRDHRQHDRHDKNNECRPRSPRQGRCTEEEHHEGQ
jgi:hypothetical protein